MLCVLAKLDERATQKLRGLQQTAYRLAPALRPFHLHGHITVAVYAGEDEDGFLRFCKALSADMPAFDVAYKRLEVLQETAILIASPEKAGALAALHRRIAQTYDPALNRWTQSGGWVPHTTLAHDPDADLQRLCRMLSAVFTPFQAHISRIEFSRITATGYEIIDSVALRD